MDYAGGRNVVPDSWPGFVPLPKLLLEEQPSSLLLNYLIQAASGRVLCKPHPVTSPPQIKKAVKRTGVQQVFQVSH